MIRFFDFGENFMPNLRHLLCVEPQQKVGQTSWTDKFFMFEALASLHIQRPTFQFVHYHSFRVRRRPCYLLLALDYR